MNFFSLKPFHFLWLIVFILFFISCDKEQGCTDETALNYNPDAYSDDGSCLYVYPVPSTYFFYRQGYSSISNDNEVSVQCLIYDLLLLISNMGKEGAVYSPLKTRYTSNSNVLSLLISNEVNNSLQISYDDLASGIILRNRVLSGFDADSIITACLDSIDLRAQQIMLLGTPAVYNNDQGYDLFATIRSTLIGSVLFGQMCRLLEGMPDANNTELSDVSNYTVAENRWDRTFAYFGAPYNLKTMYSDADIISQTPYKDTDSIIGIDLKKEYAYTLLQEAARRDLSNNEIDFTDTLFQSFLIGRTAIVNKNDTLRYSISKKMLHLLEKLIASCAVHHLNSLKKTMILYNGSLSEQYDLQYEWSNIKGYLHALQYPINGIADLDDIEDIITLLGNSPNYSLPNTSEQTIYFEQLSLISNWLRETYNFSSAQMNEW